MSEIDILGSKYEIIMSDDRSDPKMKDANGYAEFYAKKLIVDNFKPNEKTVAKPEEFKKKVLRHEIVHAFLHESGLDSNSFWADNEEMVDWFALQGPKIMEAWKKADAL